ncbi:ABC transporter permease [Granulosicoccus antarcticus]|uniref:Inner membrane transport permease YbhR n=1 Tax=Granulosicoccus antarcticus IMCC3135 TaxID=1192854 RepID=A0A2Z2NMH7_9GAMM|nr:ABC transporter permease [Granulosicoccus antarcticus]ASJ72662.1 Inner membrane transport permease YbhR [Granulosicoccus antarcticus IMCC3135]
MMASLSRLQTLVIKELLSYLRDPRTRLILIAPPLMQLLIFSFAITLEVRNVKVAVLDLDAGDYGTRLVQQLDATPFITDVILTRSIKELGAMIDERKVLLGLVVAADFSREIGRGNPTGVQLLLDGRRANAAQVASGYVTSIVAALASDVMPKTVQAGLRVRHWFNPNLLYSWFIVPSLSGVLALLIAMLVTALSIARERELGTFEQLLVSPISATEIIIGKSLPAVLIGSVLGTVMVLVGILIFQIPFTGNPALLAVTLPLFILSGVGIGLSVSAISKTQQQAILGAFAIIVPVVLTSGFATPVENMPQWLQFLSIGNPLRWYLVIVQGLFLKALPAVDVFRNLLPLLCIAGVSLSVAVVLVRRRLE